jgi:uncharacterized protein YndB with AHSA1/START domain
MKGTPEFVVDRSVVIGAPREMVFRYFTDTGRFAAWWGAGSEIEPRPGGQVRICYPGAVIASGNVVSIEPPSQIVFTYGYEGEGKPIAPGGSRVTIDLSETPEGTRVRLVHEVGSAAVREEHTQGWRYQMALFAGLVAREAQKHATERVDTFFAAWNETDGAKRLHLLNEAATEEISFRDPYSCTSGRDDLSAHLAAVQHFMPGLQIAREGEVSQSHGTAFCAWTARSPDGSIRSRGMNVYELAPDGRIRRATGFWS